MQQPTKISFARHILLPCIRVNDVSQVMKPWVSLIHELRHMALMECTHGFQRAGTQVDNLRYTVRAIVLQSHKTLQWQKAVTHAPGMIAVVGRVRAGSLHAQPGLVG